MRGKAALWLILFPLLCSFRGDKTGAPPDKKIAGLFRQANKLFEYEHATDPTYRQSLALFEKLIDQLQQAKEDKASDSILFQCYIKAGILREVISADYDGAKKAYRMAINLQQKVPSIPDSMAFGVYSYLGACYYNLNNFDSANYFLQRGRKLLDRYPGLQEKENLLNTLGVLYYDNGNYIQSRNYFNEALDIIQSRPNPNVMAIASIQTNIATALYRSGFYEEALTSYQRILRSRVLSDLVYMNMGRAHLALEQPAEALRCFRKVDAQKLPWVYNEMGNAQIQLKKPDSALFFLNRFTHASPNGKAYAIDQGINEFYRAGLLADERDYSGALQGIQKAIRIFSGHFDNPDISANPSSFTGTFASYRLFDALAKKASVLETRYEQEHDEKDLENAFSAYQSALALTSYIEKSYDTDDAKLFLKKKTGLARQQAFAVCIKLYELRAGQHYLEDAFRISEKNKASIVSASLREKTMGSGSAATGALIEEERNIKYNIARLNIRADQSQDSVALGAIAREKAKYEIALGDIQKKMEENSRFYQIKYDDSYPGIQALQQTLSDKQALISFYVGLHKLHAFIITRTGFQYLPIENIDSLQANIGSWINQLRNVESGRRFRAGMTGKFLYKKLVQPLVSHAGDKDEWIIIPDGILYFLPFESLPADGEDKTLLESHAISYQFSSRFLVNRDADPGQTSPYSVLSFAPFFQTGFAELDALTASRDEVNGLPGKEYIGPSATKENFFSGMNQYPVMHLATHAVSDLHNTAASYIAFYPQKKTRTEDFLFLEELYGLNMDKTKLMILSACETGKGELVDNEGVMSIARAFMYAGCSSVVNSLWKADDQATMAILKQFHVYLQKGYSKSKALQQAKLDYVHSGALYRTPQYWSHLILIGSTEPFINKKQPYGWAVIMGSLCILGVLLIWLRRQGSEKGKKSRRFSRTGDFKLKTLS